MTTQQQPPTSHHRNSTNTDGERFSSASPLSRDRLYWTATGLLCVVFLGSAVWELADPTGSKQQMADLGYPTYFLYPLAFAKISAVLVILSRRYRTLSAFAYAGLMYDLLLALSAHVAHRQAWGLVAASALVLWAVAFGAHQRRFPAPRLRA